MKRRITITEPESSHSVTLEKSGTRICVWCDCDGTVRCPQGKIGAETRCRVWLDRSLLSDVAIEREKNMNRFDR